MQILDARVFLYLLQKNAGHEVATIPTISIIKVVLDQVQNSLGSVLTLFSYFMIGFNGIETLRFWI